MMKKSVLLCAAGVFCMLLTACSLKQNDGYSPNESEQENQSVEQNEENSKTEEITETQPKNNTNWWDAFVTPTPEPATQTQSTSVTKAPKSTTTPTLDPSSVYARLGLPVDREISTYIFSITGEPAELTERPNGIFYGENYEARGRESERQVFVEAWNPEGELIISQNAGLRVFGAYSRRNSLKSVKLFAREEYDASNKNFKYDFFETPRVDEPEKDVKKYKKLVLRNSGNDYQFAWIRDELAQTLAKDAGFTDYEACAPAIYFLNGEYKGFYWLHENYCDNYFKNKYGDDGKNGEFVVAEGAETKKSEEDDDELAVKAAKEFNEQYDRLCNLDYTIDENYQKLCEFMDVESYLKYYAYNIYICNRDWPHNNYKCYRYYGENKGEYEAGTVYDGRWRFLLHDMDFSMGLYGTTQTVASYDKLGEVLSPTILDEDEKEVENERYSPLFAGLMKRQECRDFFVNYSQSLANGALSKANITKVLEEMNNERAPEMEYFYQYLDVLRAKGTTDIWCMRLHFDNYTEEIKTFAKQRANYSRAYLEKAFDINLH